MKAKTRFLKMFNKLPKEARIGLTMNLPTSEDDGWIYSLNVVAIEVKNDTKLGKQMLKELGYEDD
jgi:hypothetical protein